jgi:hypothetical protein
VPASPLHHPLTTYVSQVTRATDRAAERRASAHAARQARHAAAAARAHYRTARLATDRGLRIREWRATSEALEESVFWIQLLRLMGAIPAADADVVISAGRALLARAGPDLTSDAGRRTTDRGRGDIPGAT